jgi:hypothetical protein
MDPKHAGFTRRFVTMASPPHLPTRLNLFTADSRSLDLDPLSSTRRLHIVNTSCWKRNDWVTSCFVTSPRSSISDHPAVSGASFVSTPLRFSNPFPFNRHSNDNCQASLAMGRTKFNVWSTLSSGSIAGSGASFASTPLTAIPRPFSFSYLSNDNRYASFAMSWTQFNVWSTRSSRSTGCVFSSPNPPFQHLPFQPPLLRQPWSSASDGMEPLPHWSTRRSMFRVSIVSLYTPFQHLRLFRFLSTPVSLLRRSVKS